MKIIQEGNCGVYLLVPTPHVIQRRRLLKQNNRLTKIDQYSIINVESYPMHLQKEIDIGLEGNVLSSENSLTPFLCQ
jgi:hypothetical protein